MYEKYKNNACHARRLDAGRRSLPACAADECRLELTGGRAAVARLSVAVVARLVARVILRSLRESVAALQFSSKAVVK